MSFICHSLQQVKSRFFQRKQSNGWTGLTIFFNKLIVLLFYSIFRVYAFNDQLNLVNVGGCFVVFLGVVMYKVSHHIQKMEEKAFADANKIKVEYEPIRINLKKKHPNAAVTDADAAAGGGGSVSIDEYLLADEMGRQEFVPYDDDNTENGDDVDMDLEFAEDNGQWDRISRLRVVDDSEFELPVNARIT